MNRSLRGQPAGVLERPIFFDTNVLVYAYEPVDADRNARAVAVVAEAMNAARFVVSTQVMQEFYNVVLRRRLLAPTDALAFLRLMTEHTVVPADAGSVLRALALQQRQGISVWDALIVQAALDAGCGTLMTEGLQDGQRFDAASDAGMTVIVVNPFATGAPAVHEPRPPYADAPPSRRRRATPRRPP